MDSEDLHRPPHIPLSERPRSRSQSARPFKRRRPNASRPRSPSHRKGKRRNFSHRESESPESTNHRPSPSPLRKKRRLQDVPSRQNHDAKEGESSQRDGTAAERGRTDDAGAQQGDRKPSSAAASASASGGGEAKKKPLSKKKARRLERDAKGLPAVLQPLGLIRGPIRHQNKPVYTHGNYNRYYDGYRDPSHLYESQVDPRIDALVRFDPQLFEAKYVLDIGCNIGVIPLTVAALLDPMHVVGIDVDVELVAEANRILKRIKKNGWQIRVDTAKRKMPKKHHGRDKPDAADAAVAAECAASGRPYPWAHPGTKPLHWWEAPQSVIDKVRREETKRHGRDGTPSAADATAAAAPPRHTATLGKLHDDAVSGKGRQAQQQEPELPDGEIDIDLAALNETQEGEGGGEEEASDEGVFDEEEEDEGGEGSLDQLETDDKSPHSSQESFPHNIEFRAENFVLSDIFERRGDQFGVILALSVIKWVHIHQGDTGVRDFFVKVYRLLEPGGLFVLEPQPWSSYKKKAKTLPPDIQQSINAIQLKPQDFEDLLTRQVGFEKVTEIAAPQPEGAPKGFKRPLQIFRKQLRGEETGQVADAGAAGFPPPFPSSAQHLRTPFEEEAMFDEDEDQHELKAHHGVTVEC
ncbi:unnamed protein product [Vitrella brassicaformis CCMP3155]|uniref:RNA methyltransferase n=1 Tax=Vitrella brassicaformis (strain CCMP3155) TaxID=1169540 RepID=A0A0G4ETF9_VITBC|nr:unnamed protein product [Vitrella brassicaformis CCMP3155]|eukprot:CEM01594.1 unnamed protein product [Vitrella brassicaformis CCMP3155]